MFRSKKPLFEARLISLENAADIINWLGEDFYAATTGRPLNIGGRIIERPETAEPATLDEKFVIIATATSSGAIYAAAAGDYLVRYPGVGYRVMTAAEFDENFESGDEDVEAAE